MEGMIALCLPPPFEENQNNAMGSLMLEGWDKNKYFIVKSVIVKYSHMFWIMHSLEPCVFELQLSLYSTKI